MNSSLATANWPISNSKWTQGFTRLMRCVFSRAEKCIHLKSLRLLTLHRCVFHFGFAEWILFVMWMNQNKVKHDSFQLSDYDDKVKDLSQRAKERVPNSTKKKIAASFEVGSCWIKHFDGSIGYFTCENREHHKRRNVCVYGKKKSTNEHCVSCCLFCTLKTTVDLHRIESNCWMEFHTHKIQLKAHKKPN